jgi:hypothetical protein
MQNQVRIGSTWVILILISIGDKNFLRLMGEKFLESFHDPLITQRQHGHTVPQLGFAHVPYS